MQVSGQTLMAAARGLSGANSNKLTGGAKGARTAPAGKWRRAFGVAASAIVVAGNAAAADLSEPSLPIPASPFSWTGWYAGAHLGSTSGISNWSASGEHGSFSLYNAYDPFYGSGSWFGGLQAGYNYEFPNRVVIGAEADFSATSWVNPAGHNIGNQSNFAVAGGGNYGSNVMDAGTVRARLGYAPGSWLYYATGGLAWTSDQFILNGPVPLLAQETHYNSRLGWAAGAGVEAPFIPHWTAKLEYLHTEFGSTPVFFSSIGQRFTSTLSEDQIRLGLNYHFGDTDDLSLKDQASALGGLGDRINIHGQYTGTWQGYPAFHSGYYANNGIKTWESGGSSREIMDATLFLGVRLWEGAEFWTTPEVDQGNGIGGTTGAATFTNGEAFKFGLTEPYARMQRYFIRQTIDLGGAAEAVPADLLQFAGTQTADRLVITAGRFSYADIFDTNKYAGNTKTQFFNWASDFNLATDFGNDAWIYTWGAATELYVDRYAFRFGYFDLTKIPTGGLSFPTLTTSYGNDNTFSNFNLDLELEERHEIFGQPGKIKLIGLLDRGRMGSFADAVAYGNANPSAAVPYDLGNVRDYRTKFAEGLNVEQAITSDLGFFSRASWGDPRYETFDGTDTNRTLSAGLSLAGRRWDRPADTVGVMFATSHISSAAVEYFQKGGVAALIGDGPFVTTPLPVYAPERVVEAYYNIALTPTMGVSFDYQWFENPSYSAERGPVNMFGTRFHWQF
jgi:high affinity Mn2+ porin